jgi:hypothetical protein
MPCNPKGLTDLPKADAVLEIEANTGAPHRLMSLDAAVNNVNPGARNPALDIYLPRNGYDPKTNSDTFSPAFLKRYLAAMQARSEGLIKDALAQLKAMKDHTAPYYDDEPFVVHGMSESSPGAVRLNLADARLLSRTHGAHMLLKADGSAPVGIVHSVMHPTATPPEQRHSFNRDVVNLTVKQYLSSEAIRTTPDFAISEDNMIGVDWRSSGNSLPGNLENITVPTLVMAGSCFFLMDTLEISYDHSAAKDKEFVVVDGGDHEFNPCRPEFGDSQKRAFDYVDAWLNKRF